MSKPEPVEIDINTLTPYKNNARLMELDPNYADVIIKRYQEFTGEQAINVDTGETFDGEND